MALSSDQKKFYDNALKVTREELLDFDNQIEAELAKVKDTIAELQDAKKASLQMHEAACRRLGVPNEFAEEESGES